MPRRPGKSTEPPAEPGGQVNFKADKELWARIQRVCRGLGLDVANLGRMMFLKHLHHFESEVEELEARKRRGQAGAPPAPESEGE